MDPWASHRPFNDRTSLRTVSRATWPRRTTPSRRRRRHAVWRGAGVARHPARLAARPRLTGAAPPDRLASSRDASARIDAAFWNFRAIRCKPFRNRCEVARSPPPDAGRHRPAGSRLGGAPAWDDSSARTVLGSRPGRDRPRAWTRSTPYPTVAGVRPPMSSPRPRRRAPIRERERGGGRRGRGDRLGGASETGDPSGCGATASTAPDGVERPHTHQRANHLSGPPGGRRRAVQTMDRGRHRRSPRVHGV